MFLSEYQTWVAMRKRCIDTECKAFKNYGGRGIGISKAWLKSFDNFIKDMVPRPSKEYSLDRIDNDYHYCKSNCRWTTRLEQAKNTRSNKYFTYRGKTQIIAEWARDFNVKPEHLRYQADKHRDIMCAILYCKGKGYTTT